MSQRIFDWYAEAGNNFIVTSGNHTEGISEKYVGEFIASDRDYIVVATKYTMKPRSANLMNLNLGEITARTKYVQMMRV